MDSNLYLLLMLVKNHFVINRNKIFENDYHFHLLYLIGIYDDDKYYQNIVLDILIVLEVWLDIVLEKLIIIEDNILQILPTLFSCLLYISLGHSLMKQYLYLPKEILIFLLSLCLFYLNIVISFLFRNKLFLIYIYIF